MRRPDPESDIRRVVSDNAYSRGIYRKGDPVAEDEPDCLSRAELLAAWAGLSTTDKARIADAADFMAAGTGDDGDALMQEALVRLIAGTRHCPRNESFVAVFLQTMKSIAHHARKSRKNFGPAVPVASGDGDEVAVVVSDGSDQVEDLIRKQGRERIFAAVSDDAVAGELVEACILGMSRAEMMQLTGLDVKGYETKWKFIMRRLRKAGGGEMK